MADPFSGEANPSHSQRSITAPRPAEGTVPPGLQPHGRRCALISGSKEGLWVYGEEHFDVAAGVTIYRPTNGLRDALRLHLHREGDLRAPHRQRHPNHWTSCLSGVGGLHKASSMRRSSSSVLQGHGIVPHPASTPPSPCGYLTKEVTSSKIGTPPFIAATTRHSRRVALHPGVGVSNTSRMPFSDPNSPGEKADRNLVS